MIQPLPEPDSIKVYILVRQLNATFSLHASADISIQKGSGFFIDKTAAEHEQLHQRLLGNKLNLYELEYPLK